ncbi:MAG TPA: hypothetical protein PKY82_05070 [Pyrinomonadaceae bacterium]|nr:hypothetical protein [Pyrinomonadaceae bacterium]
MKSLVFCFIISFVFLLTACETKPYVYDSDVIGNDLIIQNYQVTTNSETCSNEKSLPAMSARATFRRGEDYVHLVNSAVLLINGEKTTAGDRFAQTKNNGMQYVNGIIPSFGKTFPCPQKDITFEFTDQNGSKFVNRVDLRKVILKFPATIQSDQNLEIEYENPSNSEISEFRVGTFDEKNSRNMFDGDSKTQVKKGLPAINIETKKIIIPKEVWAKSKQGENYLLFEFTTRMPLKAGEKGEINYTYSIESKVEIK